MATVTFQGTRETNKVLRNTFLLLSLTLIPTIFGTFAAMAMGIPAMMATSPWISMFAFLAVMIVLLIGIHATKDSALSIPILGVFTFVCGGMLSGIITSTLNFSNGAELISLAFIGTIAILAGCSTYASTTKRDFSSMGGFLFGALLAVIALSFTNALFFQLPLLAVIISGACLILFSMFLVYDVQRVVNGGETNYVLATTAIYLNLINIFSSLLQILGVFGGSDD